MNANVRMPTSFIPHGGGPYFFMAWNPPNAWDRLADFLRGRAASLPCTPRAIVMVSAHWLEPAFNVTSGAHPQLIYDYTGFPPHTYELKYPAPGAPQLAARIAGLLGQAQMPVQQNPGRGFDHGMNPGIAPGKRSAHPGTMMKTSAMCCGGLMKHSFCSRRAPAPAPVRQSWQPQT